MKLCKLQALGLCNSPSHVRLWHGMGMTDLVHVVTTTLSSYARQLSCLQKLVFHYIHPLPLSSGSYRGQLPFLDICMHLGEWRDTLFLFRAKNYMIIYSLHNYSITSVRFSVHYHLLQKGTSLMRS